MSRAAEADVTRAKSRTLKHWGGRFGQRRVSATVLVLASLTMLSAARSGQPRLELVRVVVAASGNTVDRIIDADVSVDGSVYVLLAGNTVRRYVGDRLVSEWGGRGPARGKFEAAEVIFAGADGIYVYDSGLYALSQFDSSGRFLARTTLPWGVQAPTSLAVVGDTVLLSGYAELATQPGQVYAFCFKTECEPRAIGGLRPTVDSAATRFFQGGMISTKSDTAVVATVNPLKIFKFHVGSSNALVILESDLLPDGEPVAFQRLPEDRISISNLYAQTTGFEPRRGGGFYYTAFFPETASSKFGLLDSNGLPESEAELPSYFAVKGVFPNGDLLVIRFADTQEVAVYRLLP